MHNDANEELVIKLVSPNVELNSMLSLISEEKNYI